MARPAFRSGVRAIRRTVKECLLRGTATAARSGMCRELLKVGRRLWTFVRVPGVEPTDNAAERSIRPAMSGRKTGFGAQSGRGGNFVERMPAVRAGCRPRGVAVAKFVKNAVTARRNGRNAPSPLPNGNYAMAS
ncbi:MAG: transposase [Planctomycetota bacterium]|jgi:transposase|nr:transposase [Planctomycetota bacterium]